MCLSAAAAVAMGWLGRADLLSFRSLPYPPQLFPSNLINGYFHTKSANWVAGEGGSAELPIFCHIRHSCSLSAVPSQLFLLSCFLSAVPYQMFLISCSLSAVPYQLFLISCSLLAIPYELSLMSCAFSAVPYQLFLISCSLSAVPYQLFLISYSLSAVLQQRQYIS